MTFIWDEKLNTGINDIDEQHEKLFEAIDSLENKELDYEKITNILIELRTYVNEHFSTEENYMKKFDYPFYEEHKALHEKFTADYNDLLLKLVADFSFKTMLPSLSELLNNWLKYHYPYDDMKMAEFLREKLAIISKD